MLLSSPNWKYQPFPLLSYFSVVVCLRCLLHHILSCIAYTFRENWDFVLIIIVQFMMSANNRIRYGLQILFVCTLHHLIIIIVQIHLWHWTYEMSARYILSSVWARLCIFSKLSIIQYMGMHVISLPNSLVMVERIYCFVLLSSSNREYELLSIV